MTTFDIPSELITTLRAAQRVAVLTGAGISAESGIPTFREPETGLWAQYRPEDLATPRAFRENPALVWTWYESRRAMFGQAQPNAGHRALAELEQQIPTFSLFTQNIDELHQRAGSQNVIELHGNLARTKCFNENIVINEWQDTGDVPPRCPRCGGMLRPDIVWFGEYLAEDALEAAKTAARTCDVFFSIGTSGEVEPAALLPSIAMRHGATVVIVNPAVNSIASRGYFALGGPAGTVLPALLAQLAASTRVARQGDKVQEAPCHLVTPSGSQCVRRIAARRLRHRG